jgi:polysaccharide biosynthesis protein PslE
LSGFGDIIQSLSDPAGGKRKGFPEMQNSFDTLNEPPTLGNFCWQHKGKLLAVWSFGLALTLVYLSLAPRKYQSEAKLFVRLGRESVSLDPTATTGLSVSIAESRESEVHAVEDLLASRLLAETVVDQFGPAAILEKPSKPSGFSLSQSLSGLDDYNLNPLRVYSLRDKAIKALRNNLGVFAANKTSIIAVTYESESPTLSRDVIAALLEVARNEHLRTHRTLGSQEFFVEQSNLLRLSLAQLEQQLRDLKTQTGLPDLNVQRTLKLELIDSLRADLVRAQAEHDAARADLEQRRLDVKQAPAMIVSERATGLPQTASQALREKLYDLEVQEQGMSAKLTADHPQLVHIRGQLGEARRVFEQEQSPDQVTLGVNRTYQEAEIAVQDRQATLAALIARTQSLESSITEVQEELQNLNDSELEMRRLERDIDLAQANYRRYAENLEEARINQELENAKISSLNVMQPPTVSETPVSPQPIITLMVGFVLSTLASIAVALLAQHRASPRRMEPLAGPNGCGINSFALPVFDSERRSETVPSNPR